MAPRRVAWLVLVSLGCTCLQAQNDQATPASTPAPQAESQPQASETPQAGTVQQQRPLSTPARRVPGARMSSYGSAILGMIESRDGIPLGGVQVTLQPIVSGKIATAETSGDGIFRKRDLVPGKYQLTFSLPGYEPLMQTGVILRAGEVLAIEVRMTASATAAAAPKSREITVQPGTGATPEGEMASYREIMRRPAKDIDQTQFAQMELPPDSKVAIPEPDRWDLTLPPWVRFGDRPGEYPYSSIHWWDPFNRNRYKGDYPVIGQNTFFVFTGTSVTGADVKRLYIPSGVSAANPGSQEFFGKGGVALLQETLRLSFELFHGDTSFKPVDWRIRITPAFNVNQTWAQQNGVVNIDVREGTSRLDAHVGLQEAFVEKKLADLSANYDFISFRLGIQQFNSDFRGLVFTEEQPGARLFGNLLNNRLQYNAAYFWFLEKDTNSGLNRFRNRHQQVMVANAYYQDFIAKGYTAEVSYLYDKDDASIHYDENGFLTRPAPIGAVTPHGIQSHYIGITGNGHFGRINLSNAFYQVLGHDDLNPIAGRRTRIDAQMAAVELSLDKDWIKFRLSGFFASGDSNPRDGVARGFDAIVENQSFSGGIFSFFNREGIRLTGTGVTLTPPDSFLTDLKSSKTEGQVNYVNPGIFVFNVGTDVDFTTKMRGIFNLDYMRFHHTAPLDLLLFQSNIRSTIGLDYSAGLEYRPPLSENIVIIGGVSALSPGDGLRQIYTRQTLVSLFTTVRFQF